MPSVEMIWAFAGQFGVTLVVAVGSAWALFRFLGDKWISNKFSERLEAFKHAQAREIEKLRLRINTAFDRTVKLHNREFEILPETWERLIDAYSLAMAFVSPTQSDPDLNRLNESELAHFLEHSVLHQYQREEVRTSPDKLAAYRQFIFWHKFYDVNEKRIHFERYHQGKALFIQDELNGKIKQLADLMWDALNEAKFERQHPNPRMGRYENGAKLRAEGPALKDEIETAIRAKLWEASAL